MKIRSPLYGYLGGSEFHLDINAAMPSQDKTVERLDAVKEDLIDRRKELTSEKKKLSALQDMNKLINQKAMVENKKEISSRINKCKLQEELVHRKNEELSRAVEQYSSEFLIFTSVPSSLLKPLKLDVETLDLVVEAINGLNEEVTISNHTISLSEVLIDFKSAHIIKANFEGDVQLLGAEEKISDQSMISSEKKQKLRAALATSTDMNELINQAKKLDEEYNFALMIENSFSQAIGNLSSLNKMHACPESIIRDIFDEIELHDEELVTSYFIKNKSAMLNSVEALKEHQEKVKNLENMSGEELLERAPLSNVFDGLYFGPASVPSKLIMLTEVAMSTEEPNDYELGKINRDNKRLGVVYNLELLKDIRDGLKGLQKEQA